MKAAEYIKLIGANGTKKAPATTPRRKAKIDREEPEQVLLIEWMRAVYPAEYEFLFHPPNGGRRAISTAKRLKAMGAKRGVPDLFFERPKYDHENQQAYFGLRIEYKATPPHHSSLSLDQKAWIIRLTDEGYCALHCKGLAEAKAAIEWYISLPRLEPSQCHPTN